MKTNAAFPGKDREEMALIGKQPSIKEKMVKKSINRYEMKTEKKSNIYELNCARQLRVEF